MFLLKPGGEHWGYTAGVQTARVYRKAKAVHGGAKKRFKVQGVDRERKER